MDGEDTTIETWANQVKDIRQEAESLVNHEHGINLNRANKVKVNKKNRKSATNIKPLPHRFVGHISRGRVGRRAETWRKLYKNRLKNNKNGLQTDVS